DPAARAPGRCPARQPVHGGRLRAAAAAAVGTLPAAGEAGRPDWPPLPGEYLGTRHLHSSAYCGAGTVHGASGDLTRNRPARYRTAGGKPRAPASRSRAPGERGIPRRSAADQPYWELALARAHRRSARVGRALTYLRLRADRRPAAPPALSRTRAP